MLSETKIMIQGKSLLQDMELKEKEENEEEQRNTDSREYGWKMPTDSRP